MLTRRYHVRIECGAMAFALGAMVVSADGGSIAVTEFFTNPIGIESTEWVELFNYGASAVDLTGWTISDEFGDTANLPEVVLSSGGYLVLTGNKILFTSDWFLGTPNDSVFELSTNFALNNTIDQIIIKDDVGQTVWNLAYQNDEASGRSTFLTGTGFPVSDFGTAALPGVSRSGDDLRMSGFLGYQQNNFTADSFAWSSTPGDVGSPLAGQYIAVPTPGGMVLLGWALIGGVRRRRNVFS